MSSIRFADDAREADWFAFPVDRLGRALLLWGRFRLALMGALAIVLFIAVIAAAAGVFGTGTAWPDLIVAAVLASLGLSGGYQIIRQALGELRLTVVQPAE